MADASFVQTSFKGGEWSQSMQGRMDHPDYKHALATMQNFVLKETEAATRRPGFRTVANTKQGQKARVISWTFQEDAPYVIEFTNFFMRFYSGTEQVTTNDDATVVTVSSANPAVVQVSSAVTWASNDTVFFNFQDATAPAMHNRRFQITVIDSTHFSLQDEITGSNIDGSTLGWGSPTKPVTVSHVHELTSPFGDSNWPTMRLIPSDKNAMLVQTGVAPQFLEVDTPAAGGDFAQFDTSAVIFLDGPYLDPFTNGVQATPSALKGSVSITLTFAAYDSAKSYKLGDFVTSSSVNYKSLVDQNIGNTPASSPSAWAVADAGTAVNPNGFSSSDIGRLVRLRSEPPDWVSATTYAAGDVVKFSDQYWAALTSMTGASPTTGTVNPNQPGLKTTTWAIATQVSRWTWGRITGFSSLISGGTGTVIGDTTNGSAAFDGTNSHTGAYTNGAYVVSNFPPPGHSETDILKIGKNFSASAQKIGTVTLYPMLSGGFAISSAGSTTLSAVKLYGSQVAPNLSSAGPTDLSHATFLGSPTDSFTAQQSSPIVITSSDQTTAWNYVWVEMTFNMAIFPDSSTVQGGGVVSQMVMFNPTNTGAVTTGFTVDLLGNDLLYSTAIRIWRFGAYGGANGYPNCGTYHEGRVWLSGAIQNRVDACCTPGIDGHTINFAPTAEDGTVTDSNAISYTFNSPDRNSIYWMEPDQQGILCGTLSGEWLITATNNNNILTPTSIQAHRVTKLGCANIAPVRTGLTLTFVQKFMRKLQEYFADVFSGKFTSPNLSVTSEHLTDTDIQEIAYQSSKSPVIWGRRGDGELIGCSYKRESLFSSQGPTYVAWHQHPIGSSHTTESITTGPSIDGKLDSLTVVQNDPGLNVRHVEVLTPFPEESDALQDACYLDENAIPTVQEVKLVAGNNCLLLHGLWHLQNHTVTVFAGGLDLGDYSVDTTGTVTVPFGIKDYENKTTFDEAYYAKYEGAMPCIVGVRYSSRLKLLRPVSREDTGARNGPAFGKLRRLTYIVLQMFGSRSLSVGTDFAKTRPFQLKQKDFKTSIGSTDLYEGVARDNAGDDDSFDGQVCIESNRAYPCNITAVGGMMNTKDV